MKRATTSSTTRSKISLSMVFLDRFAYSGSVRALSWNFARKFLFLAKERIFLRQRYGGLLKGDFRRPTFAEQTDLPEKLADLSMVPRAHRGIRARRVADIYAKMLER